LPLGVWGVERLWSDLTPSHREIAVAIQLIVRVQYDGKPLHRGVNEPKQLCRPQPITPLCCNSGKASGVDEIDRRYASGRRLFRRPIEAVEGNREFAIFGVVLSSRIIKRIGSTIRILK